MLEYKVKHLGIKLNSYCTNRREEGLSAHAALFAWSDMESRHSAAI